MLKTELFGQTGGGRIMTRLVDVCAGKLIQFILVNAWEFQLSFADKLLSTCKGVVMSIRCLGAKTWSFTSPQQEIKQQRKVGEKFYHTRSAAANAYPQSKRWHMLICQQCLA